MKTMVTGLVCERWEAQAASHPHREAIIHWDALGEPYRWTYGNLHAVSSGMALDLLQQGIKAGDVCALILRHHKDFYPLYMAVAMIGAIPSVLAYPNSRLHPEKFLHGISGMARKSGLDWVLTEKNLEATLKPLILNEKSSVKGVLFPLEHPNSGKADEDRVRKSRAGIRGSAPFLLQHSSGTTGLQKAVILSHKSVLEHSTRYAREIQLSEKDKIISWLPLYHDMGLIATFHLPLIAGISSIRIDPFQWVAAPVILLQTASSEKTTLTWLPNFAYNLMADRIREDDLDRVSLSTMRMFINGSEVVRAESHEKFYQRFRKYGLKKESLTAFYGMAETVFAVTQTPPGAQAKEITVDRRSLAEKIVRPPQKRLPERICVSSGRPIADCILKIVDENGKDLPPDRVGQIMIQSASLFDGYRNDPEKTKAVFKNGWYASGDLGFIYEGECFVIGRADDVILNGGRNIFPEDIEDAVNAVNGVIPGRVVAFGVDNPETGTQNIGVIAETSVENENEKNALVLAIKKAGIQIDVTLSEVYLVPARWLIKSSSGKISRKSNRDRVLGQAMERARK